MLQRSIARPCFVNVCIAAAIILTACVHLLAAEKQLVDPASRVRAHIRSGEFAPALKLSRELDDPVERDKLLGEIATSYSAADQKSALAVAADIADDRTRYRVLDTIASKPLTSSPQGGAQADFEPLIELITSTIQPQTWEDVGGAGAIDGFEGGVYVDAQGVLRKIVREENIPKLVALHTAAAVSGMDRPDADVRRTSTLRKVSLPRLEKQLQLRNAAGFGPTEAMEVLAGLERVQYVFVYPEQGDIVLAGPAGDWKRNLDGQLVSATTGRPILRLDDFVVLLQQAYGPEASRFGCSITPTKEALAKTQTYLDETAAKPIKPGRREAWLKGLRDRLGRQTIDVYGIDRRTRVGRILIEADYHMKLIGMGLEEGVLGVESYLDSIVVEKGAAPPPMDVLRWWFTLNYSAVETTNQRTAFVINGQGVKVLSENELLTEMGERVHTGKSNELNAKFALAFTDHFAELAAKYPVYGELRNVFDLALVAGLLRSENLPDQADWHMTYFNDPDGYPVQLGSAPETVESVINHRVVNSTHIIAGVSGGVSADFRSMLKPGAIKPDSRGNLHRNREYAAPKVVASDAWWWD